ncbi:MAG: DUF3592 domain-containing protein [Nonomuraea sp.]|nr:DUF3592 domain-containing protein [Nonomuraea sp.]
MRISSRRGSRPLGRRGMTVFAAVFGGVGLILLTVCAFLTVSAVRFSSTAERATGEVIGLQQRQSCSSGNSRRQCTDVWAPRVTFTTGDGRRVTFTDGMASSPPSYAVGEQVEVAYTGPGDARIAGFWHQAFAPLITGGLGVVFAGVGVGVFVIVRRATA